MTRKKTTEEFKQEVYNAVGDEYTVLGEYVNNKTKILMRHNCKDCDNYEYEVTPNKFLSLNRRCPECFGNIKKTTEQYKKEVKDKVGNEYTVLGEYINHNTKLKMRHNCNKCNNYEYEVTPNRFLSGRRCPKCFGTPKKTTEQYKKEVYDKVGDEYTVLGEYITCLTKILMRHNCEKCNNYEWEIKPNDFLSSGHRCPKCSQGQTSKPEKDIVDFIKTIYDKEIIENTRDVLKNKLELDIYLPDIKLAIEYNGCYWHSIEMKKENDKYKHLIKYNLCKEQGITLITIWEDEYLRDKDKCFSIINSFIDETTDELYDVIYKDNLLYINKDHENLIDEYIIYNNETMKEYEYIGDTLPELINRREKYNCWNLGYKIYKEI